MAEEIQEAVQIIRVAYDGVDIIMRIGNGTIAQIQKTLDFLIAVLDHEKAMGKESMRKLLMKGGDLQVLQFATEDMRHVEKLAKKYGLLYSALPDINKKDGLSEIIFHTEAVPRVNMMLRKLKAGRIASFDDYLKNGDEKEMDKILSFLEKQKRGNGNLHTAEAALTNEKVDGLIEKVGLYAVEKLSISVEDVKEEFRIDNVQAENVLERLEKIGLLEKEEGGRHKAVMNKDAFLERIGRYRELAERMRIVAEAQDKNLLDITITKKLVVEENDHAVKTRIPGTWGENVKYLWINKERITDIYSGKSMLTYLDKDKDYKLYSADNKVIGTMKGNELYEGHYDRVSVEIRKRYVDVERKADAGTRKRTPAPKRR